MTRIRDRGATIDTAADFRKALRDLGLTNAAIAAAWPAWWSGDAETSRSARAELRFSVARRLGLDPHSVSGTESPRFMWHEEARFKRLVDEGEVERAGITSFGRAVATALLALTPERPVTLTGRSAGELRAAILRSSDRPYIDLRDLLALSWGIGIPVVHLRVFPWRRKRMAAMAAGVRRRATILLGRDARYPAPITFYLAHEIAHIALAHVVEDTLVVDLADQEPQFELDDAEERAADAFALELLTGEPELPVLLDEASARPTARELARIAREAGPELGIEPGVLAQCFGYTTGLWRQASGSLQYIYREPGDVWREVNNVAWQQLDQPATSDTADFLAAVLGTGPPS